MQFRYRGSRRESAVAQLFSLGSMTHFYFMTLKIKITAPKIIAFLLVSIVGACLASAADAWALLNIDSMSAADYVQKERELHQNSAVFCFFAVFVVGGIYLGVIELLSYVIGLFIKQEPAA